MLVTKVKFWLFAFLLLAYLTGILILSTVSLHGSRASSGFRGNFKQNFEYSHQQNTKLKNFENSMAGFRPILKRSKINWCGNLKFLNPPAQTVALASFPGSGNTWLRYLLQQATGYYTGSVYKDYGLLKNGFPAESVRNGSVLVVKTHEWGQSARNNFFKAILLVRSPAAAIQAEFNRQSGGHIGFASPDRYRRTKGKYWQQFVFEKLKGWQQLNLDWLFNFTGPTHVIFYEQLVDKTEYTLKSVLNFIGIPINSKLFECAMERKEGIYRRRRNKNINFDPFNFEMKKRVKMSQEKVYDAIYNFASPEKNNRR